jgi:hypothetical protein
MQELNVNVLELITPNLNLNQAIGKEMSGRCLHKLTRVYVALECHEN